MNRSSETLTTATTSQHNPTPQLSSSINRKQPLSPWDKQKSYSFIVLLACFAVWACIFFPILLHYNKEHPMDDMDMDMDDM